MASHNMSEGRIFGPLASYSIILVLGQLFQLFYNMMDSVIVGRFIGTEALAAVSSASPVTNIAVLGISGLCIGSGVLMSRFFGAKEIDNLKKEFSTTLLFGLFFSLALTAIGFFLTSSILRAMNVPGEIMSSSSLYLKIVFLGIPFTYFYNATSYALKSVGDSKTPLWFLAISSLVNVALDLVLIGVFGFGVACSAITTVSAQALSAILSFIYIYWRIPELQLRKGEFSIDGKLLKTTLSYGSVTALQQSVQPICKLLIQGSINTLGVEGMATYNAVSRIDDFACIPEQGIAQGITTFVAQNEGAGKRERVVRGFRSGLLLEILYFLLIFLVAILLREPIMRFFVGSDGTEGIVVDGSRYLLFMSFAYIFPALTNGVQGFFRGIGKMWVTFVSTALQAVTRMIVVSVMVSRMGIMSVAVACVTGWSLMLLFEVPLYFLYKKRHLMSLDSQKSVKSVK